jgi:tetratricopeptide (TPR) repeat protein
MIYFELNDFRAAKVSYTEALETAIETGDVVNEVNIYLGLANLYNKFDDFESTESYLKKATQLSLNRNAYKELSEIHAIFNSCYKSGGQYEKAIEHLEECKKYEKRLMDMEEERKVRNMLIGKFFLGRNGNGNSTGNGRARLKNVLSLGHTMTGLRKH